jgi:hypothetical protein
MSEATTCRAREPEAVPLRKPDADEQRHSAWAAGEAVPLRVAAERIEAEERKERLALVTGRPRSRRR